MHEAVPVLALRASPSLSEDEDSLLLPSLPPLHSRSEAPAHPSVCSLCALPPPRRFRRPSSVQDSADPVRSGGGATQTQGQRRLRGLWNRQVGREMALANDTGKPVTLRVVTVSAQGSGKRLA